MRSSTLIPLAALSLALFMSPAVQADPPGRPNPYNERYGDRYGDRYNDRYGRRYDPRHAAALAEEIERTAYSIRREAERNNRRPDRWEARMLSALRDLNQEASQFHSQVDSRRYDNRSGRGFEELVRAYRETANVLDRNDPRPYIDRGMERIGSLLSELSRHYGRRGDYRYDRYDDRYGRNRNGRDWDRDRRDRWDDDDK